MSKLKRVNSFVKQFVAIIKGDDAQAKGEKVFRQAQSGLNTHIANLTGDTITLEDNLAEAKTNLSNGRVNNGSEITDRARYVSNLYTFKNKVTDAEEALEKHVAKVAFLRGELAELETEVSDEVSDEIVA